MSFNIFNNTQHLSYHDAAVIICAKDESLLKKFEKHLSECDDCKNIKDAVQREARRFDQLHLRAQIEDIMSSVNSGEDEPETIKFENIKTCDKSIEVFDYDNIKNIVKKQFLWKHICNCSLCSETAQFLYPERFENSKIMIDPITEDYIILKADLKKAMSDMADIIKARTEMPKYSAVYLGDGGNGKDTEDRIRTNNSKPEFMRTVIMLSKDKKTPYDVLITRTRKDDATWDIKVEMTGNKKLPKDFTMRLYLKESKDADGENIKTNSKIIETNLSPGVYILAFNKFEDMIPIVLND